MSKYILVTGSAGFIGFHLCKKLIERKVEVIGFDNINDYYDVKIKFDRIKFLESAAKRNNVIFNFVKGDLTNNDDLNKVFDKKNESNINFLDPKISHVINLAAQAGVRYSIENPSAYIHSNIVGFSNLIEQSKNNNIKHFIYASSSSVYGGNKKIPFSEIDSVDNPISLYAATKKSNELMAHAYSHLFKIPSTGMRLFTVYGPWGRPDMAPMIFAQSICNNKPIKIFNNGKMSRDFTYIDDIVESLYRVILKPAKPQNDFNTSLPNPAKSWAPYRLFNIGNSNPTQLMEYIEAIEDSLKIKAKKILLPMQPGDVSATAADTQALEKWIGFKPNTPINIGIKKFINWYISYYRN